MSLRGGGVELVLGALLHVRLPQLPVIWQFEVSHLFQSLCRVFRDRVAVFLLLRWKRSCKLAVCLLLFVWFFFYKQTGKGNWRLHQ